MSSEIRTPEPHTRMPFPTMGFLSVVLAVIPICSVAFYLFAPDSLSDYLLPTLESFDTFLALSIWIWIVCPPLALFFGIIALRQKNGEKLFAVTGVLLSTLDLLSICWFIIGAIMNMPRLR